MLFAPQRVFATNVTPGEGSWQWEKAGGKESRTTDLPGRALQKIHLGATSFELNHDCSAGACDFPTCL